MRIIAGKFRGRTLASVGKGDPHARLRPTSDRVRESLFSILAGLDVVEGSRVLDLFAGTGALGLEALSRGAAQATFVENGRTALSLLRKNIALVGCDDVAEILSCDATRLPQNPGKPCDLIFLDPPYGKGLGQKALIAAKAGGWCALGALVVLEDSAPMAAPDGFELHDARKYGDTHISLMWRR